MIQQTLRDVKPTSVMADDSQLGSHLETIKCKKCKTKQTARVLHGYPQYKYMHQCIGCGHIITKKDWKKFANV
jgi:ribosomal protein S27E